MSKLHLDTGAKVTGMLILEQDGERHTVQLSGCCGMLMYAYGGTIVCDELSMPGPSMITIFAPSKSRAALRPMLVDLLRDFRKAVGPRTLNAALRELRREEVAEQERREIGQN